MSCRYYSFRKKKHFPKYVFNCTRKTINIATDSGYLFVCLQTCVCTTRRTVNKRADLFCYCDFLDLNLLSIYCVFIIYYIYLNNMLSKIQNDRYILY